MATPKSVNLDEMLSFMSSEAPKAKTRPVIMFGREWHLIDGMNNFTFTRMVDGDIGAIGKFIKNAVVEEERGDWETALAGLDNFDAPAMTEFVQKLMEVIAGRPTEPPSPSPSSASKQTSGRKSTASSSSVVPRQRAN